MDCFKGSIKSFSSDYNVLDRLIFCIIGYCLMFVLMYNMRSICVLLRGLAIVLIHVFTSVYILQGYVYSVKIIVLCICFTDLKTN